MTTKGYLQCSRCVMDTSDPRITFDAAGRCNHCTNFLEKRAGHSYQGSESDEEFDRLSQRIITDGAGKEFDCVIGVSGGVDSSYLASIAVEKGLRPLAVHMDNGWDSNQSVKNIKNLVQSLSIGYESFVLDWEEFKDVQLAFLRASVPEAETPTDVAIPAALHHFAAKYGIKYIISGGNLATEGILPKSWHYNAKDVRYFEHIQKTFGTKKLKKTPTFGYVKEAYYKIVKGIEMVYPLNYVPFDKDNATDHLAENFEWNHYGGKHHESRYTKFIQSYYLFEKFGIDYRRASLSTQICLGTVSRNDALEELKSLPYDPGGVEIEKDYISKKLSITHEELERIIRLPAKWYWDYPNDSKKLKFVYNAYRKLYKKEKLASF